MINTIVTVNVICAFLSAKWAMELGFNQFRQLVHFLGGLLLGPFVLLILYVRLLYKAKAEGESSAKLL